MSSMVTTVVQIAPPDKFDAPVIYEYGEYGV